MSISNILIPNHYNLYENSLILNANSSLPPNSFPNQTLWINSATNHLWRDSKDLEANPSPAPGANFSVYVAQGGSDITGNGSILNPYATIDHAMSTITFAMPFFPVGIFVGPGFYPESNLAIKANTYIVGSGPTLTSITITNSTLGSGWGAAVSGAGVFNCTFSGTGIVYDFSSVGSSDGQFFLVDILSSNVTPYTFTANTGSITNVLSLLSCRLDGTITLNNMNIRSTSSRLGVLTSNVTIAGLLEQFFNSDISGNVAITAGGGDTIAFTLSNCNIGGTLNANGPITITSSVDGIPIHSKVTLAAGASITNLNDAYSVNYTPAVPGNWTSPPTTVQQALDQIAAKIGPI
jgi:hypothetical protein